MSEELRNLLDRLGGVWWRFVGVEADVSDEEARLGALLNTLAATGFVVAGALLAIAEMGRRLGHIGSDRQALLTSLFPLAFLPLSVYCFAMAKRGQVRAMARLYAWLTLIAVVAAAALFNGYLSATWLLVFWPVALGGSLLKPIRALQFATLALVAYIATYAVQRLGWYSPRMPTSPEGFPLFALAFGWVMLVLAAGLVHYLNGRSLQGALVDLRGATVELAAVQQDLTQRVDERTAELRARADQFRAIAELSQTVASVRDLDKLLATTVGLISRQLGFYHVGIFMLDPAREWAVLRAASSDGGQRMLSRGHRLEVGQQGIVGNVAESGRSRYALNVGDDAVWFKNPDLPETRSEVALPLLVKERVMGVLDIQTHKPVAFGEDDVSTLRVLADGIAIAIENAQLLDETRAALERLERYQAADAVQAWRRALARRRVRLHYTYASGETQRSGSEDYPGIDASTAVDSVTRLITEDGQYLLLAPIHVAGQQLGVLSFERDVPWTDEAVQLADAVVAQLALALDNARLLEETRLRASQEAARGEIVGRIRALTSTDAILRNAAEELGRALQVERSRIQLAQFDE